MSDIIGEEKAEHITLAETKEGTLYWTSRSGNDFHVRETEKRYDKLPPGIYEVGSDMTGYVFMRQTGDAVSELLNFEEANSSNIVSEIKKFWSKKELFEKHNIPFKRGILFYGPPGSGKSSVIKLITRDVVADGGLVFFYNHLLEGGFELLREVEPNTPILVIMEDLDVWIDEGMIDFLDGHNIVQNIVFLATTNYIDRLPDTIRNRPSRFDRRIYVGTPSEKIRMEYLKFLTKNAEQEFPLERWAKDTHGLTFAHLKELYIAIAFFESDYVETLERLQAMMPGEFNSMSSTDNYMDDDDDDDDYAEEPPMPQTGIFDAMRLALTAK